MLKHLTKKSLLLSILLTLSSCTNLPPKPILDLCVVDPPLVGSHCAQTNPTSLRSVDEAEVFVKNVRVQSTTFRPLDQMDNFVCLSPGDIGLMFEYIRELRKTAQRQCQQP